MAKEIIFKTIINNGDYSCGDIGISTYEWYNLLLKNNAKPYIDVLLCFLREPGHTGSCTDISKKYGNPAQYYSSKVTNFSRWVQKELNRFQVKGTDGKDTYWSITMKKGWESDSGFQWQMRDELVKALQRYLMNGLIQDYRTKEPFNGNDEEYKWALLDAVEGKGVGDIIKCLRGKNVVYNEQVDVTLKTLWETKPSELTTCINDLLDETRALLPRIEDFRDNMRNICPSEWKSCANDERTASAILTCRYPNDYTFYKSEVYQVICKFFGFEYRNAYLKFAHYIEIINDFVADFGEEIQEIMMPQIGKYSNKPLNLAVQTLFWCLKEEMKADVQSKTQTNEIANSPEVMQCDKYLEYIDLLKANKNLILTGAPGTGKTYMAKAIAEEMGADVGFVQFHPSYGYTDFVEGLRPIKSYKSQLGFERKNGVFKDFCERALSYAVTKRNADGSIIQSDVTLSGAYDLYYDCYDTAIKKILTDDSLFYYDDIISDFSVEGQSIVDKKISWVDKRQDSFNLFYRLMDSDFFVFHHLSPDESIIEKEIIRMRKLKIDSWERINSDKSIKEIARFYFLLFHWIVEYAKRNYERVYLPTVFIIDEINRGEISKIFGELFFSIDPGYRGEKGRVCTQYQNMIEDDDVFKKGFYVPENVYIIGTMNDIDRSVESMDFAIRRRFTWKEVTPTETAYMLDDLNCAAKAKATMERLNKVIEETEGLGAAYMIGPAYFLKLDENGGDFKKLWEMNIEPLLKEYLRGFRKAKEILEKYSKAYFYQIDED